MKERGVVWYPESEEHLKQFEEYANKQVENLNNARVIVKRIADIRGTVDPLFMFPAPHENAIASVGLRWTE